MTKLQKLLAVGVLAGALGIGSASLASAQETGTTTTVQSDDGSSSADDGSATDEAPADDDCPERAGEAPAES